MIIQRSPASAVFLLCLALTISCAHTTAFRCPETATRHWEVAPEWLKRQVSAAEIEALWRKEIDFETIPEAAKPELLALFRAGYRTFSSKVRAGDELWFFSTPQSDWDALGGRSGFVAIRRCRVAAVFVVKES